VVEHCHALRVYEEVPRLEDSADLARHAAGLHPHHQQGGVLLHPHVEALKQRQCLELREDDVVPFRVSLTQQLITQAYHKASMT